MSSIDTSLLMTADIRTVRGWHKPHEFVKYCPAISAFSSQAVAHRMSKTYLSLANPLDLARLNDGSLKRLFYVHGMLIPLPNQEIGGSGTAYHHHVVFAYQTSDDKQIHWLIKNFEEIKQGAELARRKHNVVNGVLSAAAVAVTFPISLFFAKDTFKQDHISGAAFPSQTQLEQYVVANSL